MISERVWKTLSAGHQVLLKEGARSLMKDHIKMVDENEVARPLYDQAAAQFGKEWVDRIVKAVH